MPTLAALVALAARHIAESLGSYSSGELRAYRIGTAVNNVKNGGPERMEEIAADETKTHQSSMTAEECLRTT